MPPTPPFNVFYHSFEDTSFVYNFTTVHGFPFVQTYDYFLIDYNLNSV